MSTGIHVEDSDSIVLRDNYISGVGKGIEVKRSTNVIASGNTIIEKAILAYGPEFADVIKKVETEPTPETSKALEDVMTNTATASKSWAVLIKRYGINIGRFSVQILSNVLAKAAYEGLKDLLQKHGINI